VRRRAGADGADGPDSAGDAGRADGAVVGPVLDPAGASSARGG